MINNDTQNGLLPEMIDGREALHEGTPSEGNGERADGHQPIIGIPIPVQQGNQGPLLLADAVGPWAIERMHGRIFLIPLWPFPTHKHVYQSLWSLVQSMDGLFLPAGLQGTDWSLHWEGRENPSDPQSWPISWEMALAQLATYIGMPLLAVADGAEKWNSALGGKRKARQEAAVQMAATAPDAWERHAIRVRAQSHLAAVLHPLSSGAEGEQKPWELAFMPEQGVEKIASGLRSCAQSKHEAVAAFERRDAAFGLGVLGRLDWGLDHAYGTALFEAFLHACRSFDDARQRNPSWEASRDTICATVYERVTQGQPLIAVPHEERRQRSGPLVASPGSTGQQERLRLHPQPTKEELNRMRRQRLKQDRRQLSQPLFQNHWSS